MKKLIPPQEMAAREVRYADKDQEEQGIIKKYPPNNEQPIQQEHLPYITHSVDKEKVEVKSKAGIIKTK